ncbi:FAD-dependent monooxygenase [Microbacterium album]|uniref:FAD-dependent oxidoreductase n=1 Tax=Microbacterium album TaxID=2053191 RepID=A0A917IDL0_9MICO|nr:FAD-dependent monooxygenase [Microbacterium album]GGH33577.1 FAD-dependent oxidoreductase [Microbacterium album]
MTVNSVLVLGGGFTGLTSAIALALRGVENVTLVERAPAWARVGHGITVQGNALKVFQDIGVVDEILRRGFGADGVTLFHADGSVMMRLQTPKTGGEDLPATLGALRADVHEILVERALELGVKFRLGTQVVSFENHGDSVSVLLSDGTTEFWDLMIAADGIKSSTRPKLGITAERASSGLGIWRGVTNRLPEMTGGIAYPAPGDEGAYKVGYTAISATQCYVFVLCEPQRTPNDLPDWQEMKRLMEPFHGEFDWLRESLNESTYLNFQEIEWIFVEEPWHRGRVIALGEAVHAVPPLIAQGAAQCVEDALLIADYVTREGDLEAHLTEFQERRIPRIKGVVDASLQLAYWECHPGSPDAQPGRVMAQALAELVAAP